MIASSVKTCPALPYKDSRQSLALAFQNWFPLPPALPACHSKMISVTWSHFRNCLMSLRKTINKPYVTVTSRNKYIFRPSIIRMSTDVHWKPCAFKGLRAGDLSLFLSGLQIVLSQCRKGEVSVNVMSGAIVMWTMPSRDWRGHPEVGHLVHSQPLCN